MVYTRAVIICVVYVVSILLLSSIYMLDSFSLELTPCEHPNRVLGDNGGNLFQWNPIRNAKPNTCFAYPASFPKGKCLDAVSPSMAATGIKSVYEDHESIIEDPTASKRCIIEFGGAILPVPSPTEDTIAYAIPAFVASTTVDIDISRGWPTDVGKPIEYQAVQGGGSQESQDLIVMGVKGSMLTMQMGRDPLASSTIVVFAINDAGKSTKGITWLISLPPLPSPSPLPPSPSPLPPSPSPPPIVFQPLSIIPPPSSDVCVDCSGTFRNTYFNDNPQNNIGMAFIYVDPKTGLGWVQNGDGRFDMHYTSDWYFFQVPAWGITGHYIGHSGWTDGDMHWSNNSTWARI